jgi:putative transcriptional regulator
MDDPTLPDPPTDNAPDNAFDPGSLGATYLTGKLLIAMPSMEDPRFAGSVVLMCAHGAEGAMGLIVNKEIDDLSMAELFEQMKIAGSGSMPKTPVCYGGPVEMRRGFVLHEASYQGATDAGDEGGLQVDSRFGVTTTRDILEEIASGRGPSQTLMVLGYAGWGPGQLEGEIAQNGWLTTDAAPELVFSQDMASKWEAALATLGVHPLLLSPEAGHA